MAKEKERSTPSDESKRIDDAKDKREDENPAPQEHRPEENREEWWKNEGGGQGEVY